MSTGERRDEAGRQRALERVREWFLLDGRRLVVAGVTAALVFLAAVLFARSDFVPLATTQPVFYLFSSLLGGNLTLVTVVVSINQLLLSRELNTPGELRSEIDDVFEYRGSVEAETGQIPPEKPRGFLRFLHADLRERTRRLADLASRTDGRLEDVAVGLGDRAIRAVDVLGESGESTFHALSATLTTNYAEEVRALQRARSERDLDNEVEDAIDDVIDRLKQLEVARHYFKSVYFKEELAGLSRLLFYVGFPSVFVIAVGLLALTASEGAAVSTAWFSLVVPAVFAVGLLPLCVLFSFVVRIAVVTERTAARLPFTTADQER